MNEKLDLYVGQRVRWRRRLLGLSQSNLADLVGVRYQQIQKYECAVNRLSAARLWHLACALGVEVQYFYEGWVDTQAAAERRDAPPMQTQTQALAQTAGLLSEQQGREPQTLDQQSQAA
jgi:transcriptional regulator with XRE-family HTH domain